MFVGRDVASGRASQATQSRHAVHLNKIVPVKQPVNSARDRKTERTKHDDLSLEPAPAQQSQATNPWRHSKPQHSHNFTAWGQQGAVEPNAKFRTTQRPQHCTWEEAVTGCPSVSSLASNIRHITACTKQQHYSASSRTSLCHSLRKTETIIMQQLHEAHPSDIASIFWVYAKLHHSPSPQFVRSLSAVFEQPVVTQSPNWILPRDLSLFAWALAKTTSTSHPDFNLSLLLHAVPILPVFRAPDYAQLIWSAATTGTQPSIMFMTQFLTSTHTKLPSFKAKELSMMIWALATLRCQPPAHWLDSFCTAATPHLPAMKTQELANVLWGLATISRQQSIPQPFLLAFMAHSTAGLTALGTLDALQIVWAAGRIESLGSCRLQNSFCVKWIQALLDHMVALLTSRPSAQQQPDSMLSQQQQLQQQQHVDKHLGTSGSYPCHNPASAQQAAGTEQLRQGLNFRQQQQRVQYGQLLSMTLVSIVRLRYRAPSLCIRALLQIALPYLDRFSAQELSNTLWALGQLRYKPCTSWLQAVMHVLELRLPRFHPRHLSLTIWSSARLEIIINPDLAAALLATCDAKMGSCTPSDLATTLWGLALWDIRPPQLWMSKWLAQVQSRADLFHAKDLVFALKAVTALRVFPSPAWVVSMTTQVVNELSWFGLTDLTQALQALDLLHTACRQKVQGKLDGSCVDDYNRVMARQLRQMRKQQLSIAVKALQGSDAGEAAVGQQLDDYFQSGQPAQSDDMRPVQAATQIVVMGLRQQRIVRTRSVPLENGS